MNAAPPSVALVSDAAWRHACAETRAKPASLAMLEHAAAAARAVTRLTVVDKTLPAPSGDPHDFVSQGPYWWPDPAKPDGLPYIRRDGDLNPESMAGDRTVLDRLVACVTALGLHAEVAGDAASALHADRLVRQWFLDPETRMNPHLRYGQRIPGRCEGRGIGIIDTAALCFLVDGLGRRAVDVGVRSWFGNYLEWLLASEHGRTEGREHNNHGTWYDVQVVTFALFCGRADVARRQLEAATLARIDRHIAADGRQPHELARTRALSYSVFNALGFVCLASAGRSLGFDLWAVRGGSGAGIADAVRWLVPYALGEQSWTWPQIVPFQSSRAALLFSMAADGTGDPRFEQAAERLAQHPWDRAVFVIESGTTSKESA